MVSAGLVWKAGVLMTASGIGAGAFGAHSLASRLKAVPNGATNWSMASNYAIVNGSAYSSPSESKSYQHRNFSTVALLAISQHPRHGIRAGGPLIAAGTIIFSGSIFALLLFREKRVVHPFVLRSFPSDTQSSRAIVSKTAGPATPFGGLFMIAGYLSLLI